MRPGERLGARAGWVGLVLATLGAAWTVGAWVADPGDPSDADWESVAVALGAAGPDDGIAIIPPWTAADHARLRAAFPGYDARLILADPPLAADLVRFPAVWTIAPRGDALPAILADADPRLEAGPLRLSRWEMRLGTVVTDFRAGIADAEVDRIDAAGKARRCTFRDGGHRCDDRYWSMVGEVEAEVGFSRRRAILAHPSVNKGLLRIAWPAATLGDRLSVGVGYRLRGARKAVGKPARFVVRVDGRPVVDFVVPMGQFEWHTFAVDTSGEAEGPHAVTVEVSSDDVQFRQVTFDLLAWDPAR